MKAAEIVEAIERFFLDIIGIIVPGVALLFGFGFVLNIPVQIQSFSILSPKESRDWIVLIAASYVLGHAVTSLGHSLLLPGVESIAVRLKKVTIMKFCFARLVPQFVVPESELMDKIKADPVFKVTVDKLVKITPELSGDREKIKVHSWRNIAMSMAPEQRHTIYRFMFLSQLNLGIATVLFLMAVVWPCASALATWGAIPEARPLNGWLLAAVIVALWPFLERRYRFYSPAMQVPFSMALVEMQKEVKSIAGSIDQHCAASLWHKPDAVYLAGGFQSGWQDKVKLEVPQFTYYDPRGHGLENKDEYTLWDLEAVRRCNWVFAYLEPTNPGGYALALEIGYAKALGKRVIFVDEKSATDAQTGRYLAMIAAAADVVFTKLEDGIDFLKKLGPIA